MTAFFTPKCVRRGQMSEHENRQLVEQAYVTFKAGDIPTLLQSIRTSRGSCQRLKTCLLPASDGGAARSASSFRPSRAYRMRVARCQLNRVAQWHRLAQFHPSMRKNPLQIKRTRYPLCQTGPSLDTVYGAQPVSPNARPRPSRKARPRSDRRRCPNSSSFVSMDGECRMCFRKIIVFSRQT